MNTYVDYVYDIIRLDCEGLEAIYADYITRLVGNYGFNVLLTEDLLESCGIVHGRQLYVLKDKKPTNYSNEYEALKAENTKLRTLIIKGI